MLYQHISWSFRKWSFGSCWMTTIDLVTMVQSGPGLVSHKHSNDWPGTCTRTDIFTHTSDCNADMDVMWCNVMQCCVCVSVPMHILDLHYVFLSGALFFEVLRLRICRLRGRGYWGLRPENLRSKQKQRWAAWVWVWDIGVWSDIQPVGGACQVSLRHGSSEWLCLLIVHMGDRA